MDKSAARLAAEALFGDLLEKPVKAGKAKKEGKKAGSTCGPVTPVPNPVTSPFFTAEKKTYEIITQVCRTCGGRHRYTGQTIVRYRALRRKDGLAIELPTSLPHALDFPGEVVRREESVDFCPACVEFCALVDDSTLFTLSNGELAKQGRLFS